MGASSYQTHVRARPPSTPDIFSKNFSRWGYPVRTMKECYGMLMIYASRKKYEVVTDKFSNTQRLNLFAFDGAPINPMYLAYKPPQMLPTQPLNPTSTSAMEAEQTSSVPTKRGLEDSKTVQMLMRTEHFSRTVWWCTPIADRLWWFGAGMTALGGVGYFFFWTHVYHNCERCNIFWRKPAIVHVTLKYTLLAWLTSVAWTTNARD